MGKEEIPSRLEIAIAGLDDTFKKLIDEQAKTNRLLDQLIKADHAFIGTLTSFLDLDHRLKLEQERKRDEQARSLAPTKHDFLY